jgi:signal transduction histidine kinase
MKLKQQLSLEIILLTIIILGFDLLVNNYLFFHVIVELFSIVILFVLFSITWNARNFLENRYLLFVGMAAGFIGVLDLLHTLTYKGMNIIESPLYYANQFWIATRFFESIVLLTGFIFLSQRYNVKVKNLLIVYSLITTGIILSILYFEIFPTCYIENYGQTAFKIYSEYIIILILISAFVMLIRKKRHFENQAYTLIAASILLTIVSEFCFTLYIANYDYINKIGHVFKVLSFYMIYKANIESGFRKPIEIFFNELKISQEKIKESHLELEKQVATKNKFFSIISHDLKNPISVLVGFAELLLNQHKNYSEVEREKMYQTIFSTSEKTYKLLENLLSWARTQTNNIPVNIIKIDLKSVLDENIFLSNATLKEIEIVKEYDSHIVIADYDMVNTIVRNLLSNAIKYTPRFGKVIIRVKPENSQVKVSFIDNGVGIPENKIDQLFQVGKTFSTKGTEKESGTGLGLILCAEFIARNNGEISVESKPGQGSVFTFALPSAD